MKRYEIRTVIENFSRFPIDCVWENAQDLEHVTRLHSHTNASFQMLCKHRNPGSEFEYDLLIYRAIRKVGPLRIQAFGFRKIISRYQLHQYEYIPVFKTASLLNSLLYPAHARDHQTRMIDEVILEIPGWLFPLKNRLKSQLKAHALIQCTEDEPFRERRMLLAQKAIHRPFRTFGTAELERLGEQFRLNLWTVPSADLLGTLPSPVDIPINFSPETD